MKRDYVPNCTVLQFNCLWNTVIMFPGDKPSAPGTKISLCHSYSCQFKKGSKPLLATLALQIISLEGTIESVSYNIYVSQKPNTLYFH